MNLKIKELIYRKNSFLTQEQCNYFIYLFEKYSNLTYQEHSLKYIEGKKNTFELDNFKSLNLNLHSGNKEIQDALFKAWEYISLVVDEYIEHLKLNVSTAIDGAWINTSDNIRILKYSEGHSIKDHLDVDNWNRASCTINLNESYVGGEFSFFSGKHIETFKTGDAMIFPAEPIWVHGTKPVISGTRYAINCFLHHADKHKTK
jgi:hypothetical protein